MKEKMMSMDESKMKMMCESCGLNIEDGTSKEDMMKKIEEHMPSVSEEEKTKMMDMMNDGDEKSEDSM